MNKMFNATKGPAAVGPYSHAVIAGNTIYVSGQLGIDPAKGQLVEGVVSQAKQGFINLEGILKEAGFQLSDVVKTTVFLTDMANFAEVNAVYGEYFSEWKPARSCVAVQSLPLGGEFEIEVVAVK